MNKQDFTNWSRTIGYILGFLGVVAIAGPLSAKLPTVQQSAATFATPDEAVQAIVDAAEKNDTSALLKLFGTAGRDIVQTGDPSEDRDARAEFARLAHEKLQIVVNDAKPDTATFSIGQQDWPFPVPLVRKNGKWQFDVEQGRTEIVAYRIGRNELSVIEVCRGFVEAELEYASLDRDQSGMLTYARKIKSSAGKQDGLYWDGFAGALVPKSLADATAPAEKTVKGLTPYHGYYFRILDAQGPDASGGAFQYVVNGKMIGGFALVAWPSEYGVSGIKTFIVNHDGTVYEKDLGPKTTTLVNRLMQFDPDSSWERVVD
jgi:hypothetical protein